MKFRTTINIPEVKKPFDYNDTIAIYGSCFSEHIAKKLTYYKFKNTFNSHGIIFSPRAIEKAIYDDVEKITYKKENLLFMNDLWLSLKHHTSFSSPTPEETLEKINSKIEEAHQALKKASHILITPGTAWIYEHTKTHNFVANCHKISQKDFKKRLMNVDEIVSSFSSAIRSVRSVNPTVNFIFTVSPVRHLKDGFTENSRSKAHLIAAIHELVDQQSIFYFPSYEIMMDDLREYRFYEEDLVHPNKTAVDYIWEKFKAAWINKEAFPLMDKVESIQKDLHHRPFRPESEGHQKFLKKLAEKIQHLEKNYPFIRFNP